MIGSDFGMQVNREHQEIIIARHMREGADRQALRETHVASESALHSMLDHLVERLRSIGKSKHFREAKAH